MSLILDEIRVLQENYSERLNKRPDFIALSYPLFEKLKRELKQSGYRGFLNPSKPTIFGMSVLNYKAPYDDGIKLFGTSELKIALIEYEKNPARNIFSVQRVSKVVHVPKMVFNARGECSSDYATPTPIAVEFVDIPRDVVEACKQIAC